MMDPIRVQSDSAEFTSGRGSHREQNVHEKMLQSQANERGTRGTIACRDLTSCFRDANDLLALGKRTQS